MRRFPVPSPRSLCGLLVLSTACAGALAGDIYRWVDEQGKVHLSDRPPPDAPKNLRRQDARPSGVSPKDQRDAADRAARDSARLRTLEQQRLARERTLHAEPASPPASAASQASAAAGNCAERWAEWHRSTDCYGPFRTKYGGFKPGALAACGPPVLDPSPQCGPGPQVTPTFEE